MRVLALSFFDPASAVLSHRDLMRKAGHDFRLAVVRAYTERQRSADYVCEQLVYEKNELAPGVFARRAYWEKLAPNLEELRSFAASADVIQFHPGIGHGDGDWASRGDLPPSLADEADDVLRMLDLYPKKAPSSVLFIHGSNAAWRNLKHYKTILSAPVVLGGHAKIAASTIDYATELDAAYLPPLVDVGDLRAPLRGDDDPLLIAHTPTDRIACSTEEFLKISRGLGIVVRLGEGIPHDQVLSLKAECNAGFDHLRGAFSVNTLENAAIGLVPLHAMRGEYITRMLNTEEMEIPPFTVSGVEDLHLKMRRLSDDPCMTRKFQALARQWWQTYFSADPIMKRLTKFYESL